MRIYYYIMLYMALFSFLFTCAPPGICGDYIIKRSCISRYDNDGLARRCLIYTRVYKIIICWSVRVRFSTRIILCVCRPTPARRMYTNNAVFGSLVPCTTERRLYLRPLCAIGSVLRVLLRPLRAVRVHRRTRRVYGPRRAQQ